MSSRTISLERSAYERLRAAKQPGESFSTVVVRLLDSVRPSFRSLAGTLTPTDADRVQQAIRAMRWLEAPSERKRLRGRAGSLDDGRQRRH